jgi:hypothetical protein
MSLTFKTNDPDGLLHAFRSGIDQKHIVTWSYDRDGDFTHTPEQWARKAWLRPEIQLGQLCLHILRPNGVNISSQVYAVYHGRFLESMLVHCDHLFSDGSASALPNNRDQVAA